MGYFKTKDEEVNEFLFELRDSFYYSDDDFLQHCLDIIENYIKELEDNNGK